MDIGSVTIKDLLEKKMGEQKAAKVLKKVDHACSKGITGDELRDVFKEAIEKEGHEPESILYAFHRP